MKSRQALLVVDFFNPEGFGKMPGLARAALAAAKRTAMLKRRLASRGAKCIYVNDNFGNWRADFASVVAQCSARGGSAGAIAEVLMPGDSDWSVLKPRHSAFYGTPLEFMLEALDVRKLVLTGISADACIAITAQDAHVRRLATWIPADCVASTSPAHTRAALAQLRRVTDADTRRSTGGSAT